MYDIKKLESIFVFANPTFGFLYLGMEFLHDKVIIL